MALYATAAQVAIRMQKKKALSADELVMLDEIIEGVSRNIDRTCRRAVDGFATPGAASARYYAGEGETHLQIDPCTSITTVSVKDAVGDTAYVAWNTPTSQMAGDGDWVACSGTPEDPNYNTSIFTLLLIDINSEYAFFREGGGVPTVEVLAVWGALSGVPADIQECCAMQSIKWFKQYQSGMSDVLGNLDYGEITYRRGLDKHVRQILIDGNWILPLYAGELE